MNELLDYKRKRIARLELTRAIKKGSIVRSPKCNLCNKTAHTQGHHVDYGKPLDVKWLCHACHGYAHRKEHPLNPLNNPQTSLDIEWEEGDSMTVSFIIPMEKFIHIKQLAEKENLAVSQLVRELILASFSDENQLEFNYGDFYDDPQNDSQQRVPSVEEDEEILLKQELPSVQIVWSQRGNNLPRMDQRLQQVLSGNGTAPRKLQRAGAPR